MCGRYFFLSIHRNNNTGSELFDMIISLYGNVDSRDITPGMEAPVLIKKSGKYVFEQMEWGMESGNSKLIINARCENLRERPMFSGICDTQRCIIPASGYYEWRKGDRQRFQFTSKNNPFGILYFAGVYRFEGEVPHFTVITRRPTPEVAKIHNRMPMILKDKASASRWLMGGNEAEFMNDAIELNVSASGDEQLSMDFS